MDLRIGFADAFTWQERVVFVFSSGTPVTTKLENAKQLITHNVVTAATAK